MTNKTSYTQEEWQLLMEAPMLVGTAVLMIGPSGFSTMKETVALAKGMVQGGQQYPNNELIRTLSTGDEAKHAQKHFSKALKGMSPEQVKAHTLGKLQAVLPLLEKATEGEAAEYKQWVLAVGQEVAEAAKEHGVRVSEPEKAVLTAVAQSLNVSDYSPNWS